MSGIDEQPHAEERPAEEDLALEDEETDDVKGGAATIRKPPPNAFEGMGETDGTLG